MPDLHLRLHDEETGEARRQEPLAEADAIALLHEAEFTVSKLIPWGSNYTFAVGLETPDGRDHLAIYKPASGETPLWDFPDHTLYLREHAAYLISKRLGWHLVPPTIIRDGPNGIGSLQIYVEPVEDRGRDDVYEFWGRRVLEIERLVLFDHITNNADRKMTHCLIDVDGRVWGIDHGLTFNESPKLRTVLWQYAGHPISAVLLDDLKRIRCAEGEIRAELAGHLSATELDAFLRRIDRLLAGGAYPVLDPRRNVPYGWW